MNIQESKIGLLSFPGSPLTYPTVQALQEAGFQNISVIFDGTEINQRLVDIISTRTQGRARFHTPAEIKSLGVKTHFVSNHNHQACLDVIQKDGLVLLASCGTPRKLKVEILNATKFGILNCHPGKLPEYRGSSSVEWSLQNGDPVGCSAHFMAEEYDAGPIINFYPLQTKGKSYSDIRLDMIAHQSASLADAIGRVLKINRTPAEYSPQNEGKIWPVYPDSNFISLSKRNF